MAYVKFGWFLVLCALALTGCATKGPEKPGSAYADSIYQSAVFDPAHVHPLVTIAPTEDEVEVVSWTSRAVATQYYHPGATKIGIYLWVTRAPELQHLCAGFPHAPAALTLRLQQALGLPAADEDRVFVVMAAHRTDIFRPCPDPDPAKPACAADFPPDATEAHRAWIGEQVLSRYRTVQGYPWTRLGYTYDWAPGSSGIGLSEFVIRKGATADVRAIVDTPAYCAGSHAGG